MWAGDFVLLGCFAMAGLPCKSGGMRLLQVWWRKYSTGWKKPFFADECDSFAETTKNKKARRTQEKAFKSRIWMIFWVSWRGEGGQRLEAGLERNFERIVPRETGLKMAVLGCLEANFFVFNTMCPAPSKCRAQPLVWQMREVRRQWLLSFVRFPGRCYTLKGMRHKRQSDGRPTVKRL